MNREKIPGKIIVILNSEAPLSEIFLLEYQ